MSVANEQLTGRRFSCSFVIIIMLFSTLASLEFIDNAKASINGDIAIIGSTPSQDAYIPAYDPTYFTVELTNLESDFSDPRTVRYYVCLGVEVTNICISQSIDDGKIDIPTMAPGETNNYTSGGGFYPNGINETITVIYQFEEFDLDPSNDVLNFQLNSTLQYTDVQIETNENILDSVSNVATFNGVKLFSNDMGYNFTFSGFANICADCHLNATLGWQLWTENQSEMLAEHYEFRENFPKFSFYKSFQMLLPTFQYNQDGVYTLVYGIFNSTGNPFADQNNQNNLNSVIITINTELDLSIDNLYPSHNPSEQSYLYGEDMVSVAISNNGNSTARDFSLQLIVSDNDEDPVTQFCNIAVLGPNQQRTCVFDMPLHGNLVTLEASLPSEISGNVDSNILDNSITEVADVIVAQLATAISMDSEKEWFTDNEEVTVTAQVNPYSAGPVNYSWWYSGIINIDYGQSITINTSDYGLGSHSFKLVSSDVLGNSDIIYFNLLIFSEIYIENLPYYSASATSPSSSVEIEHSSMLPIIGEDYNIGGGKTPLMLYQFDLTDTADNSSIFDGQNWLDVELSLFHSIPDGVPYSSIEFRKLSSFEDVNWEFFNTENYGYVNQTVMFARLYEPTTILVIGSMGEPDIEARNFSVDLISKGNFELSWEPNGDFDSDYILGWNIHQKIVPDFGGTIFQSPQENYNELIWDDLVSDSFREFVPLGVTDWQDLITVPAGFCSSYAIIPVDRTGETYNHLANVSMQDGVSSYICGDSTPPSTFVINMSASARFTNDTTCYNILKDWSMCYEVTVSWEWPEGEVDETWDLYRTEQEPNGMDMTLLQPIISDMTYVAGESFTYTVSGIDDDSIKPSKTYYYILTPTDEYGNERTIAFNGSANVKRVHIEDGWWKANPHLIPEPEPEPEPPLNSEWLGNFSDSLDQQAFQMAGIVTLSTLCIGVIMLAFIAKRLKRLRKVVAARNRRQAAESMADEFEDFFN